MWIFISSSSDSIASSLKDIEKLISADELALISSIDISLLVTVSSRIGESGSVYFN